MWGFILSLWAIFSTINIMVVVINFMIIERRIVKRNLKERCPDFVTRVSVLIGICLFALIPIGGTVKAIGSTKSIVDTYVRILRSK